MFGSSRVNKSTKKFAPRAPVRRNKDTTSSKDAASPAPQSTSNTTPAPVDNRATPGASKPPPGESPQQESDQDHERLPEVTEGGRERDKGSQDSTRGDLRPQAQTRQEDGVTSQSSDKPVTADVLLHDTRENQRDGSEIVNGQVLSAQVSEAQASTIAGDSSKELGASQVRAGIQQASQTRSSTIDASSVQQLSTPAPTESAVSEVVSGDDTSAPAAGPETPGGTHISTETPQLTDDQSAPAAETPSLTESSLPEASRTSRTSKAKRKRSTEGEPVTVSTEGGPVAKKPRKVRKDKGTTRKPKEPTVATTTPATEGDTPGAEGEATATSTKRKRASKKRAVSAEQILEEGDESEAEADEDDEEGSQKRKRKRKRKERSPTPEDAEYIEVDETTVTLQDLTADRRQGQVSSRERAMREIDWDEVARRRKERLREPLTKDPKKKTRKAVEEEAEEGDAEAEVDEDANPDEDAEENFEDEDAADEEDASDDDDAPFTSTGGGGGGVTLRMVDGRLVVDETSAHIDRHAAATAPDTLLETVEEDDLTTHITQHSFLHANKRDPADRRPTPNDRWRLDDDDKFYAALGMFGTDFAAIARMFPGRTRRNIKHKFTREERQNPDLVRAALVGQVKATLDIKTYLRESDRTEADLLDPKALAAELDALRAEKQPEIDAARKEFTEMERQKRIAEGAGLTGKEEEGTKKKTRRKKRHEPKGGEEVEIIGTIEDGLWGL